MSEHVEKDYYTGYIDSKMANWLAHSQYHKICKHFITSESFNSFLWHTQNKGDALSNCEDDNMNYWSPNSPAIKANKLSNTKKNDCKYSSILEWETTPNSASVCKKKRLLNDTYSNLARRIKWFKERGKTKINTHSYSQRSKIINRKYKDRKFQTGGENRKLRELQK